MAMSDKQKEDLAWVTRIITIALLGIASVVGMSVYDKVDEMYSDFKTQKEINTNLKQADITLLQEIKELKMEIATIRSSNYQLQDRINKMTE